MSNASESHLAKANFVSAEIASMQAALLLCLTAAMPLHRCNARLRFQGLQLSSRSDYSGNYRRARAYLRFYDDSLLRKQIEVSFYGIDKAHETRVLMCTRARAATSRCAYAARYEKADHA